MAKKKGIKSFVGNMIGFHDKEDEEKKSQTVLGGYDIKIEDSADEANKSNKPDPDGDKKDDKSEEKPDDESKNNSDVAEKKGKKAGKAPTSEQATVSEVVVGTGKIQAQPKDPAIETSLDIVDVLAKYDKDNLPLAAAQLFATNGKTLNGKLAEVIRFAIRYNAETRAFISREVPDIILEYPEQVHAYSVAVNKVSSDIRMKFMYHCPIDNKLYETQDLAFDALGKDDIIAFSKGIWKFADAWVRTDSDGRIIAQDDTVPEAEVRNLIASLPKAIQQETADKLHIKWGKKDKPDKGKSDQQDSGNTGKDVDKNAKDGSNNRKNSGGGKKSPKQS